MKQKGKSMKELLVNLLIVFVFLLTCIACCKDPDQGMECVENIKEDCGCTMQYDPVCGCNNQTYGNSCVAYCHGITDYTEGACE